MAKYKAENPGAIKEPEKEPEQKPEIVLPKQQKQPAPEKNAFSFNFNGVRAKPDD